MFRTGPGTGAACLVYAHGRHPSLLLLRKAAHLAGHGTKSVCSDRATFLKTPVTGESGKKLVGIMPFLGSKSAQVDNTVSFVSSPHAHADFY